MTQDNDNLNSIHENNPPQKSEKPDKSLQRESALYVELAELLKVERNRDAAVKVQKILDSQWPVSEKIWRIKEIDKKSDHKSQLYLLGRKRNSDEDQWVEDNGPDLEQYSDSVIESKAIAVNKKFIKKKLHRSGALRFLFRELGPVSSFASRTGLIKVKLFPPSLKLSKQAERFFLKRLRPAAKQLLEPLSEIEENGWMLLSKFRYNLVRELQQLCIKIVDLKYEANRNGEKKLQSKFHRLEKSFFICHFQEDYSSIIEQAVQLVWRSSKKYREQAVTLTALVREILQPAGKGPSLYELIRALQIIEIRRFVEFDHLISRSKGAVIDTFRFNCDKDVLRNIKIYCDQKEKNLQQLHMEYQRFQRFQSFLSLAENGDPVNEPLEKLIQGMEGIIPLTGTLEDDNMLRAAAWSCDRVNRLTEQFLGGVVLFDDGSQAELFKKDTFQQLLAELQRVANSLDELHMKNRHIIISRERLEGLILKTGGINADDSRSEQETVEVLIRYGEIMYKIAEELAPVILKSGTAVKDKAMELLELRRQEYFIPYGKKILIEPLPLQGLTVADGLHDLASALYTAAWFFQNRRITLLLCKQQQLHDEMRGLYFLLERLTDLPEMERIRQLYPAPV